ncbi:MAG: hypothetical protein JWN79_1933 [Gemmatimonadetes bacterium]|nr:hypothetical protein [Gemmatimonadota bacterium]
MKHAPATHRWAVDGIEEGIARIEEDGERILSLPEDLLPPGTREGALLTVTRTMVDGALTLTIVPDPAGTDAALARSGAQVAKIAKSSKQRDGGGDVAL